MLHAQQFHFLYHTLQIRLYLCIDPETHKQKNQKVARKMTNKNYGQSKNDDGFVSS